MASHTFPSSKSWPVALAVWGTIALVFFFLVREPPAPMPLAGKIALGLVLTLTGGLLLWMWFGTHYRITGQVLQYRCGPIHGGIPIRQITKITCNQYLWSGLRPGLGLHGVVLYYHRWDEIYLSPADQEGFIQALQEVNPEIEVEKGS